MSNNKENQYTEFGLTSASVNNRKTVFLIIAIILLGGIGAYMSMPKESFPELQIPEIYVGTPYPGGSPEFVEDKITQAFEKEINSVKNVDEITSTSIFGYSSIKVTFNFKVTPEEARRKVDDAITLARSQSDFPELPVEPMIMEMDISEMPIMNVNLSGEYSIDELKEYGEILQDEIEALSEISEVDIRGVQDKQLKIEMRKTDAEARNVSFQDIQNAVNSENVTMPGGEIQVGDRKRSIRIEGEFENANELKNIIVKEEDGGNEVYLHEVADVYFGDADTNSYAREFGKPVVMLDVKKRSGENLLIASDKIKKIVKERAGIPQDVVITLTNDMSNKTLDQVSNLENSIIFGVILVVLVLMFFLGLRNALFVGVAIPLSMFMSFLLLNAFGVTLNVMVLFSLVLALGMLVDNGIVVVENVYRLMDEEGMDGFEASKKGVGEIAWPIIASTATTLAAFIPLALWPGIMGEFMKYLPITLIVVLGSSLFVALVINPVLTALYMKIEGSIINKKRTLLTSGAIFLFGVFMLLLGNIAFGNLLIVLALFMVINAFLFVKWVERFQEGFLPRLENAYESFLKSAMNWPKMVFFGTFALLIISIGIFVAFPPKVLFFPDNEAIYANIFVELPVGTSINETNSVAEKIEKILDEEIVSMYDTVYNVVEKTDEDGNEYNDTIKLIQSIITQVGEGTSDPAQGMTVGGNTPHKARITVSFSEFMHRKGTSTNAVMDSIRKALDGRFLADVKISVDKDQAGPPMPPPINIEVQGPGEYDEIIDKAEIVKGFLMNKNVKGVERLKLDVETGRPELLLNIDRNKARRYGLSTYQIANTIRTAVFGDDISTYKLDDETYDINLRFSQKYRNDINQILDQKITFRNNKGQLLSVPIRSVIKDYTERSTYGSVKRNDLDRVVTVYSNVVGGANANEIVAEMKDYLAEFEISPEGKELTSKGYTYKFTGQQEDQAKEMAFLSNALLIAVFLILLIIVSQFNSFSSPAIILFAVVLSLIGVFLGLVISQMDFVVIMSMIGIISLAGVVVNNAIVLIDYTNLLRKRKKEELGMKDTEFLPLDVIVTSIVQSGKTRLRPVLLTAITTVLGLIPLAVGLNIDFVSLFTKYDANIYMGGDNVMFFGPMSWTIIFGLTFATFLTLVFVPVMYLLLHQIKVFAVSKLGMRYNSDI